jgi:hypothetical protein
LGLVAPEADPAIVVLGRFPNYLNVAKSLGAKVYDVANPSVEGNMAFIDQAVATQSRIMFSDPPFAPENAGSMLEQEALRLQNVHGYTITPTRAIPPPQ